MRETNKERSGNSNFRFYYNKNSFTTSAREVSGVSKVLGLMFRLSCTDNLIFDFAERKRVSFHSLFVFFPFLIIWLDEKNRVVDARIVSPFRLRVLPRGNLTFSKVLELPLNSCNERIFRFFVGQRKI